MNDWLEAEAARCLADLSEGEMNLLISFEEQFKRRGALSPRYKRY